MPKSANDWKEGSIDIKDLKQLLPVLARSLYGNDPRCAIRELALQNPHDACLELTTRPAGWNGPMPEIHVFLDSARRALVIRDHGIGMTEQNVTENLAKIGGTSKEEIDAIKAGDDIQQRLLAEERIGKFGMGFLSGFIVANKIGVRTLRNGEMPSAGVEAEFTGETRYQYRNAKDIDRPGTEVTLFLKPEYCPPTSERNNLLSRDNVESMLRQYGNLLRFQVFIHTDPGDLRGRRVTYNEPPWWSTSPLALGAHEEFHKQRFSGRNKPLAIFPVHIRKTLDLGAGQKKELVAGGQIYIPNPPSNEPQEYGRVEIYVKRMYVCEDRDRLLPEWAAHFVNGLIDTPSLTETLDRNDVIRTDRMFAELKMALEEELIRQLRELQSQRPQDFKYVMAVHGDRIRAAATMDLHRRGVFSEAIADSITVPVYGLSVGPSGKWMPVSELLESAAQDPDGTRVVSYFHQQSSRAMLQDLTSQQREPVVDASDQVHLEFLRAYQRRHDKRLRLKDITALTSYVHEVPAEDARKWEQFIEYFHELPSGGERVRASVKDFSPAKLPAILLLVPRNENDINILNEFLHSYGNYPVIGDLLREKMDSMKKANTDLVLYLNAANPLLQDLRKFSEEHGGSRLPAVVGEILHEIYHNAMLYAGIPQSSETSFHIVEHHSRLIQDFLNALRGERRSGQARSESEEKVGALQVQIDLLKGLMSKARDALKAGAIKYDPKLDELLGESPGTRQGRE